MAGGRRLVGLSPHLETSLCVERKGELVCFQALQPDPPLLVKLLPVAGAEFVHGSVQQWPAELLGQGRADALVGLLQSRLELHRHQFQALAPTLEGFVGSWRLTLQSRRWCVGISGADRAHPGLVIAHLPAQGDHLALVVQQQQIAVTAHQLEHDHPLNRFPWTGGQTELHHPFKTILMKLHQGHLAKAVLQLLGQGAAGTAAGRWWNLHQSRRVRLPAQFKPHHARQGSEPQLEHGRMRLLCFLETAWQQGRAKIVQHCAQAGEIHQLKPCRCHHRCVSTRPTAPFLLC